MAQERDRTPFLQTFSSYVHAVIGHFHVVKGRGYLRASRPEIEAARDRTAEAAASGWPLTRATPPLLWHYTVDAAATLGLRALIRDE